MARVGNGSGTGTLEGLDGTSAIEGSWGALTRWSEPATLRREARRRRRSRGAALVALTLVGAVVMLASCGGGVGGDTAQLTAQTASSCMQCHNGAQAPDYSGPGLENPHPFPGATEIDCHTCHGGNPDGQTPELAHVPPPPQIGDEQFQTTNRQAYFNALTLTGLDKFPDYTVGGQTYTSLDYLRFVNPGDLRVTAQGVSCGQCHSDHSDSVSNSMLATAAGIFSGAMFAVGAENEIAAHVDLYEDAAADLGFRAVTNPAFNLGSAEMGEVGSLLEVPVYSVRNDDGPEAIDDNPDYFVAELLDDLHADGRVVSGSALANLYTEQVAFTCGDCHLGSRGANNRAGDFRSSGCTSCHMPYSLGGRSGSNDPHVNKLEPLDPDDIDEPEQAHVRSHRIVSVARTLSNGVEVEGIDDYTCAGCHQGSNRTVMQYWGIRLDQNQDVRRGVQYPANPNSWQSTTNDQRLFPDEVGNNTFNGRNRFQYLLEEDYDGDGRDDTPPDVHYAAGMGCIDCHGSFDLHGGRVGDGNPEIQSRMSHAVSISCESCHGTLDAYASTVAGANYAGVSGQHAVDGEGNVLKHVVRENDGNYYLYSRLTGTKHYIPQTRDTAVDTDAQNPFTLQDVYSDAASYAMGRIDASLDNGLGPIQQGSSHAGFSHTDRMDCASCHSSWTNTCMGCHLEGEYDEGNNFSNITGDRIVFEEDNADFTYQSPLPFQLGIGEDGKVTTFSSNTKVFFRYEDRNNDLTPRFSFSDRNGQGANPADVFPSLSHNAMMAHSIRGRVDADNEGPRYCVACHLTDDAITNFGSQYDAFRTAMQTNDFAALDFGLLQQHIGENTGNQLNSPFWVHMVAGLGSGVFLFDDQGRPVNPLDNDNQREPDDIAPASVFDVADVAFNLDRIVTETGATTSSNNHPLEPVAAPTSLRDGASDLGMSGPLGFSLLRMLADPDNGLVLDSWYDADGQPQGQAGTVVGTNP